MDYSDGSELIPSEVDPSRKGGSGAHLAHCEADEAGGTDLRDDGGIGECQWPSITRTEFTEKHRRSQKCKTKTKKKLWDEKK